MHIELTFRQVWGITAIVFAIYFPVAIYLQWSYQPQPKPPVRHWLMGPFNHAGGAAWIADLPKFDSLADSNGDPYASDLVLYEDEERIGPAHSVHRDIVEMGGGRYSHWKGQGLIFSASDNGNPNINWKLYWVRVEPPTP